LVESEAAGTPAPPPKSRSKPPEPMHRLDVKTPPPARTKPERAIKTRWYWLTLVVSLFSLIVVWLYYSGRLYFWLQIIYWITGALALGLLIWSIVGLLTHYNVMTRMSASAERMRDQRENAAGGEEAVVYRENVVVRLFKGIVRLVTILFLFVWNTFLRLLYIAEITVLQTIILGYDLIYYVSYAAWTVSFFAIRLALRIVRWALRVAWKILRILTLLPIAKGIWRNRWRPSIMGKWNARIEDRRQRSATRLEQKRRLIAAQGGNPDKWQADREARHYFFLPHPHEARRGLRARIEDRQKQDFNRRDRWSAYRKGLPLPPKYHSERKKAILEEKKKRKAEKKAKERGARDDKRPARAPRSKSVPLSGSEAAAVPDEK
jgi:hypothetical protein